VFIHQKNSIMGRFKKETITVFFLPEIFFNVNNFRNIPDDGNQSQGFSAFIP